MAKPRLSLRMKSLIYLATGASKISLRRLPCSRKKIIHFLYSWGRGNWIRFGFERTSSGGRYGCLVAKRLRMIPLLSCPTLALGASFLGFASQIALWGFSCSPLRIIKFLCSWRSTARGMRLQAVPALRSTALAVVYLALPPRTFFHQTFFVAVWCVKR
jgi:hypothetical protein